MVRVLIVLALVFASWPSRTQPPSSGAVNVLDFGANGQDAADDTQAIQFALNTGQMVHIPAGVYHISAPLHVITTGQRISGDSAPSVYAPGFGTVLVATGAIDVLTLDAMGLSIEHLSTSGGARGIVFRGASRSMLTRVVAMHAQGDGFHFSAIGNNNLVHCAHCLSVRNGGHGYRMVEQLDNNGIELFSSEAASNTGHGVQYSGQGLQVMGGIYEGNGGFGIKLSNDGGDLGYTIDSQIAPTWLEGNALGGVGGGKSVRNIIRTGFNMQGYVAMPGWSEDYWIRPYNGGGPKLAVNGQIVIP